MNKSVYLVLVLTITASLSGGILAYFDTFTSKRIEAYQNNELKKAIRVVLPGIANSEQKTFDGKDFYIGKDSTGKIIGVAFVAVGDGFQSKIKIFVGMDPSMQTILALKVMEQAETPGLGSKIIDDPADKENRGWFTKQFENLDVSKGITFVKNKKPSKPGEIQAITGATISSKSVVYLLNNEISKNREIFMKYRAN